MPSNLSMLYLKSFNRKQKIQPQDRKQIKREKLSILQQLETQEPSRLVSIMHRSSQRCDGVMLGNLQNTHFICIFNGEDMRSFPLHKENMNKKKLLACYFVGMLSVQKHEEAPADVDEMLNECV